MQKSEESDRRPVTGVRRLTPIDSLLSYLRANTIDIVAAMLATTLLAAIMFAREEPILSLTYDSHDYIAASENLNNYLHGLNSGGHPYLIRQPLLPAYLHFFDQKILAAAALNCICFFITIFSLLKIGRVLQLENIFLFLFLAALVFSYSFLQLYFLLLTEPLFIAMLTVLLYQLLMGKNLSSIILLLIFAFLARKAAAFFLPGILIICVMQRRVRNGVILIATAGLALIAWELFTYYQHPGSSSANIWSDHFTYDRWGYIDSLTSWLLPRELSTAVRLLIIVIASFLIFYFNKEALTALMQRDVNKKLITFILSYVFCLMLFWGAADFYDADRFLAVILPFFMLYIFSMLNQVNKKHQRWYVAIIVIWLLYPISKSVYYLANLI